MATEGVDCVIGVTSHGELEYHPVLRWDVAIVLGHLSARILTEYLGISRQDFTHRDQTRRPASSYESAVESAMGVVPRLQICAVGVDPGAFDGGDRLVRCLQVGEPSVLAKPYGTSQRDALDLHSYEGEIPHVVQVQGRNPTSSIYVRLNQPLCAEARQGLANDRGANTELFSDVCCYQRAAGGDIACKNPAPERLHNECSARWR